MDGARALAALKPGETGTIARITGGDALRVRLMEMGVLTGERVRVLKYAPLGDPVELLLSGYHLSIRKREAECILVSQTAESG